MKSSSEKRSEEPSEESPQIDATSVRKVLDQLGSLFQCRHCAVVILNPTSHLLEIKHHCGLSRAFCQGFQVTYDDAKLVTELWQGL